MQPAFTAIVDYAGLFPPASCGMAEAVANYAEYRHGPDRWMLGRFVVAASRLGELTEAVAALPTPPTSGDRWGLSVVVGAHLPHELERIHEFTAGIGDLGLAIEAVEAKIGSPGEAGVSGAALASLGEVFLEVPHQSNYAELAQAIQQAGAFAKIRTGGTTADAFPTAIQLTRFLIAVTRIRLPFKATAGLHHPWRGRYRLSYAADAERHTMFGFVNLLMATAVLRAGGDGETAQAILEEERAGGLRARGRRDPLARRGGLARRVGGHAIGGIPRLRLLFIPRTGRRAWSGGGGMTDLDRSHDPARSCWVPGADGHPDFPIQNLPWGATEEGLVVAIGDHALNLAEAQERGWGGDLPLTVTDFAAPFLNMFLLETPSVWRAVRLALSDALSDPAWREALEPALAPQASLQLELPFHCGDYTDFYASVYHATNVGSMFRPDNPLLPNYKWIPIGYHGRASTLVPSGTVIRRPRGQTRPSDGAEPGFGPTRLLDYELELGLVIGGTNRFGEPVPAARAAERIFGAVLLNDWSARDVQAWEYQPLGPFLAKNFASTISPWVVTSDALAPYRVAMPPRPEGDPAPLEHLRVPNDFTWSLALEVELRTAAMRERGDPGFQVSRGGFAGSMYWSPAQLVTHHASNGCVLQPGDLLGTGTISGPEAGESRLPAGAHLARRRAAHAPRR